MKRMKRWGTLSIAVLCTVGVSVQAKSVDLNRCTVCHGDHFQKRALGRSDVVARMSKQSIYRALKAFKNTHESDEQVMRKEVEGLSDKQLRQIADTIGR